MATEIEALVVDDSAVIRRIIVGALTMAGVKTVDQAADGAQALEAVDLRDYGLILMDWNMPNMTGIEAVREIRDRGKDVPIIMVTTESERSRVLEAIKAGVNDYVMKPFSPELLAETIRRVLGRCTPSEPPSLETG